MTITLLEYFADRFKPILYLKVGTNAPGGTFTYSMSKPTPSSSVIEHRDADGEAHVQWNLPPDDVFAAGILTICVTQAPTVCLDVDPLTLELEP